MACIPATAASDSMGASIGKGKVPSPSVTPIMAASANERSIISRCNPMNKTASANWLSPLTAIIGGAAQRLTFWLASVTAVPVGRENDGVDRPVWRSGTELDRSWGEQMQSLADALEAWRSNPLARRLISLITAYTIGDGIRLTSSYRPLARFIRELYAHPLNNLELELPEWSDELSRSGELFLTLHTNPVHGMSYVRAIPASATATGNAGELCFDANFVYCCVAANTWKRAALSSW